MPTAIPSRTIVRWVGAAVTRPNLVEPSATHVVGLRRGVVLVDQQVRAAGSDGETDAGPGGHQERVGHDEGRPDTSEDEDEQGGERDDNTVERR